MCNPISLIMSADSVWFPASDAWDHSHTSIASRAGLPDGLLVDKYARVEVRPRCDVFRDPATNAVLAVDETWEVVLDEAREPGWWSEDRAACVDRAREAARRWLADFPAWLVPGLIAHGGEGCSLVGGNSATLTATGNYATLTANGNYATLTAGDKSSLSFSWLDSDSDRFRVIVAYVGEDGIEPGVAYKCVEGKVVKAGGVA